MANLEYSSFNSRRSHWIVCANAEGAFAVFVILLSHMVLHGLARPSFLVLLFHIFSMLFAVATFVYCFLEFPYQECRNSSSEACNVDKVAVPMDGVLMYPHSSNGW